LEAGEDCHSEGRRLSALADAREPEPVPERLLEAEDVAGILGMTTDWVYREVRAKRLPHIRLGRYVRFRRESIEAWLDAREHRVRVRQLTRGG
jgi:excisionase family DNA binding protein